MLDDMQVTWATIRTKQPACEVTVWQESSPALACHLDVLLLCAVYLDNLGLLLQACRFATFQQLGMLLAGQRATSAGCKSCKTFCKRYHRAAHTATAATAPTAEWEGLQVWRSFVDCNRGLGKKGICEDVTPPWEHTQPVSELPGSLAEQAVLMLETACPKRKAHLTHVCFRAMHSQPSPHVGTAVPPASANCSTWLSVAVSLRKWTRILSRQKRQREMVTGTCVRYVRMLCAHAVCA